MTASMAGTEPGTTVFACSVIKSGGVQGTWLHLLVNERFVGIGAGG